MAPSATLARAGLEKSRDKVQQLNGHENHDLVLRTFRVLIADLVEQFKGGHPG
jgi:dihydroxyacetone synthase